MIIVFGSINLDLVTQVPRIPAPGETVLGPSYTRIPGGKGANQALAARRAGAKVSLVGATGIDAFADMALSLLLAEGVDLSGVSQCALPTGAAFISIDATGQNAITVAAGANSAVRGEQVGARGIHKADTLLLQREVPDAECETAAKAAKVAGARVILNLAPSGLVPDTYLQNVDILIMNEHEAADLAGGLKISGDFGSLAQQLHERFQISTVVTLGDKGAVGWESGVSHQAFAIAVKVVDTTAAGDTFTGAFAAALDEGRGFAEAMQRGVVAGSLACRVDGAQLSIPTKAAIDAAAASLP